MAGAEADNIGDGSSRRRKSSVVSVEPPPSVSVQQMVREGSQSQKKKNAIQSGARDADGEAVRGSSINRFAGVDGWGDTAGGCGLARRRWRSLLSSHSFCCGRLPSNGMDWVWYAGVRCRRARRASMVGKRLLVCRRPGESVLLLATSAAAGRRCGGREPEEGGIKSTTTTRTGKRTWEGGLRR